MPSAGKRVVFGDFVFFVDENVYGPAEDSFLFAKSIRVKEGECVLDMGTGCGILGTIAARGASEVVAVDVNPYALRCAKKNAYVNHARSKMEFLQGDLFTALGSEIKFDVVLFNAPYLPVEAEGESWLERAWAGGAGGRRVIDRFITKVKDHLSVGGRVLLLQSTLAGVPETLMKFEEVGLKAAVVAECAVPFFETIVLFEARS